MVKSVEKRIWDVEGFAVTIKHQDGRDMRGDRTGIPMYGYLYAAKVSMTVAEWKAKRFFPTYPGFEVDVLDGLGSAAAGNSLLSTVRGSYEEE